MPTYKLNLAEYTKSKKVVPIKKKTYFYVKSEGMDYIYDGIYQSYNKAVKAIKSFMKKNPELKWGPFVKENSGISWNERYNTTYEGLRGNKLPAAFIIKASYLDYNDLIDAGG